MNDLDANRDTRFVNACLRSTKRRIKLVEAGSGLLVLVAYTLVALTAVIVADHIRTGGLSAGARLVVRWCYLIGAIGLLMWLLIVPVVRWINDLFAAREIEHRHPEFRNSLISALQLVWRRELPGSTRAALAARAADDLAVTDLWRAVDRRAVRRTGIAATVALAIFLLYAALAPKPVMPSIRRALGFELPAPTRTQIVIEQPPPDHETLVSSPVRMVARITGRRPDEVFVRFSLDEGKTWSPDQQLSLSPPPTVRTADPRERQRWRGVKSGRDVQQSMHYQFVAGDARSEIRLLRVRPYPKVASVRVRCDYPKYTGLAPTEHQGGDVDAVIGTRVTVYIRTAVPAETPPMLAFRKTKRGRIRTQPTSEGGSQDAGTPGKHFVGRFRVEANDEYIIDYRDRNGVRNLDPIVYAVRARPDAPPQIELEQPDDGVALSVTDAMRLICRVTDDFGLTEAVLETQVDQRTGRIPLVGPEPADVRALRIERAVALSELNVRPGQRITWWVTVKDNRHDARGGRAYRSTQSEKRHLLVREEAPAETAGRSPTTTRHVALASRRPTPRAAPPTTPETQTRTAPSAPARAPDAQARSTADSGAPQSQPSTEELARFVETYRQELEALKKRLEGDAAVDPDARKTQDAQPGEPHPAADTEHPPDHPPGSQAQSRQDARQATSQQAESAPGRSGDSQRGTSEDQQTTPDEGDGRPTATRREPQAGPGEPQVGQGPSVQAEQDQSSQPGLEGENETGEQTGKQPGQSAPDQPRPQTGKQPGQPRGDQPAEETGDQSSEGTADQSGQQSGEDKGKPSESGKERAGPGKTSAQSEDASSEGKASPDAGAGGGASDSAESRRPTPDLPATRPRLDHDTRLSEPAGPGRAPASTTDRMEQLVNELDRRLRSDQPDPNLLKELGWTPEQARRFVREFRRLKDDAPTARAVPGGRQRIVGMATSQPGEERRRAARGRDTRVRGGTIIDRRDPDEIKRLLEVRRQQIGREYRELLEAYYKTVAAHQPARPTTQQAEPAR